MIIPQLYVLCMQSALLIFEMQQVMALRMMRVAAGGALAPREARRMVSEKALATAQIGFAAAMSAAGGDSNITTAQGAVRGYRARVRGNYRRLTRR